MNKISISCWVICLLILSGCSNPFTSVTSAPTVATVETIAQVESKQTGVPMCDKYLATLRCLAQASTGTDSQKYITTHNDLLASRKDIPVPQLTTICTSLTNSIISNPQVLLTTNCKI